MFIESFKIEFDTDLSEIVKKKDDEDMIWDDEDWEDPEFLDMVKELKEKFGEDWEKKLKELSSKIMKDF